jgi:DNA-binding XRE family transcriptional regulator
MRRKNWHWDINLPYSKIEKILSREDDPRFARLAGSLLSRVQNPKEVFALISPQAFCRRFQAIQREIVSDEWSREKAAFWKATYLRMSREFREKGEKIRKPAKMKLDDFDRRLIEKVKECRKGALMSQKELAGFLGCSQQYISGIETGREKIKLPFLKKLVSATDARIDLVIGKNTEG